MRRRCDRALSPKRGGAHARLARPFRPRDRVLPKSPAIQRHEWFAVAVAFAYFFCVLAAYYVLRPVRDQLSALFGQGGVRL